VNNLSQQKELAHLEIRVHTEVSKEEITEIASNVFCYFDSGICSSDLKNP